MDPISVLQNRIEQLEAKLGFSINPTDNENASQVDTTTANLLNTAQAINNATAGHEKLSEAMPVANELNNYTDPNIMENMQQNNMHMQQVAAAEPLIRQHCQCMHHCKKAEPVLDSQSIAEVPQMQPEVEKLQAAAAEVKVEADAVSHGVQELADTCGTAASDASEQLANVAQNIEKIEQKLFPRRRNGLD